MVLVGLGVAFLWLAVPVVGISTIGDCVTPPTPECEAFLEAKPLIAVIILGLPLLTTAIGALAVLVGRSAGPALLLALALGTLGVSWATFALEDLAHTWVPVPGLFFFFFGPGALLVAVGCAWQVFRQRR